MKQNNALFIVDLQKDFLPGGALGVPQGDEIIRPVNRLMESFDIVLASKDWHPQDTVHFEKWPAHCVRGTEGAAFPETLNLTKIDTIFLKGTGNTDDGYSAFEATNNDLRFYLSSREIDTLYIAGLATDYCVMATAMDAIGMGLVTHVIPEAVRAVNLHQDDGQKALEKMRLAGVNIIALEKVVTN